MTEILTEAQYRQIELDSYSSLKEFATDRKKYYKKYILNEQVPEEEDFALKMGALVDCIIFSEADFDKKFYLSTIAKPPSGAMGELVEALYKRTMEYTVDGVVTTDFLNIFTQAYNDVKFDANGVQVAFKRKNVDSLEEVLKKFEGSDTQTYYEEIRKVRPNGLCVVTDNDLINAHKIKDELLTNPFTQHILRQNNEEDIEVLDQQPVFCEIDEDPLKGLVDRLIVNHSEKTIDVYDLKVTWNVEEFYEKYYLYRKSYLQAVIYDQGVKELKKEKGWEGYVVRPMKFLVADSINYMSPLIYELTEEDLEDGRLGFVYKNRPYTGLYQIMEDLKWHKNTGIWNISRENHKNNGICKL